MKTPSKQVVSETKKKRRLRLRRKTPSLIEPGNSEKLQDRFVKPRSSWKRKHETIEACAEIHGASESDKKPCLDGMWVTLVSSASSEQLENYVACSKKTRKVLPSIVNKEVAKFEENTDNLVRSVKVLYCKGLISKEKYKSVRLSLCMKSNGNSARRSSIKVSGVKVPKILTYEKVISFLKSIHTGKIMDMKSEFCGNLKDEEQVEGAFRQLEDFLLELSSLYIHVDKVLSKEGTPFLHHFNEAPYSFKVAVGADGAPFGKDDEATAWLLSFLNVGHRIASQNENFLLAGANCPESHVVMKLYAKKLVSDIAYVESKNYNVAGYPVQFKFTLVPSDMKWLATFAGELSNAAHYFSSFANVHVGNKDTVNGAIGEGREFTWQPWNYNDRLAVAARVKAKQNELDATRLAPSTKRSKLTQFIKDQKSRQESEPIIAHLVDYAFAEPLHNSNNAWQYINSLLLEEAVSRSNISVAGCDVSALPDKTPLKKFVLSVKNDVGATRLYKKIIKWLKEGRKKKFEYRFTGKETKCFCHKFMFLIDSLKRENETDRELLRLMSVAFAALQLREAVSKFSRVETDAAICEELGVHCQLFFNTCSLLLRSISPTVWTVGYAIPFHNKELFRKFGLGLGINTMQGREAKHVTLSSFAQHATLSTRWSLVMRHEYIRSIWLRKIDPFHFRYARCKDRYTPKEAHLPGFCYCGFKTGENQAKCVYCSSNLYKAICRTAQTGELDEEICNLLSLPS